MTSPVPASAGPPRVGRVGREGRAVRVIAPAGMPGPTWLTLAQELAVYADGAPGGNTSVLVPVARADELRRILAEPWPAGQWDWEWTAAASDAADRAGRIGEAVRDVLDHPPVTAAETAAATRALADLGFVRSLLPAQAEAVAALARAGGGGNFSVPGSGKTTMTYAIFALLRGQGLVRRMLVLAPLSAHEAWREEAADCFGAAEKPRVAVAPASLRLHDDVVVVNYERAAGAGLRAQVDGWDRDSGILAVFDEAHRAKRGASGLHGRGARDLSSMAAARLVLTGTPVPNSDEDLAQVLDLAWPGSGARLAAATANRTGSNAWVRVTKQQLGLDPVRIRTETVRLDDAHARLYEAVASGAAGRVGPSGLGGGAELASRAVARLVAAASNPALLLAEPRQLGWPSSLPAADRPLNELVAGLAESVRPAKLIATARIARRHADAGTKVVVWSNFLGTISELARVLEPYSPAVVTGAVPPADPSAPTDRVRELARFRTDPACTVLIATPQTLGEGVSLHRACQAQVFVDRTFNAGLFLQALDRTHRVGMPAGTEATATVLVAAGTLDEAVDRVLRAKLLRMDAVLDDPTLRRLALPDEETDAADVLEPAEIDILLAHLRSSHDFTGASSGAPEGSGS